MRCLKGDGMTGEASKTGFLRHVRACHNAQLPGQRIPFRIGGAQVGWMKQDFAAVLGHFSEIRVGPEGVNLIDATALQSIARALSDAGHYRWRREAFDVRAKLGEPVLAQIDRGALPSFGILAEGVHVNGLVQRPDGPHIWIARRAANKQLDPGKLDHIVAGGVPSGLTPTETLVKEAAEEASIPASLASQAVPVGSICYAMERPEGLRRDHLYCFDLELPPDFQPIAADGEVEGFELWPLAEVATVVRDTDHFKFNVNLVLIDLLLRRDLIGGPEATTLRTALTTGCERGQ
jgi:8-oxo-dGTP pyrophosphatase MutT (NUDIX family)